MLLLMCSRLANEATSCPFLTASLLSFTGLQYLQIQTTEAGIGELGPDPFRDHASDQEQACPLPCH